MIVYDLSCAAAGHVFEAWFGSASDYEAQQARGLVSCPICGGVEVGKAVMAPRIAAKGSDDPPDPAKVKAMLGMLAKAQAEVLAKSEHVGPRFAAEARAIHAGDAPERAIHGQATRAEAKALVEEGVPVAPLPLPVTPPPDATH